MIEGAQEASSELEGPEPAGRPSHRASYRLEVGVWRARCKVCGWETGDRVRSQAAALFRRHIVAARKGEPGPFVLDLRETQVVEEDLVVAALEPS